MIEPISLERGKVYGLSNGALNKWDKVERGALTLEEIIHNAEKEAPKEASEVKNYMEEVLAKEMMRLMKDDIKASWGAT